MVSNGNSVLEKQKQKKMVIDTLFVERWMESVVDVGKLYFIHIYRERAEGKT